MNNKLSIQNIKKWQDGSEIGRVSWRDIFKLSKDLDSDWKYGSIDNPFQGTMEVSRLESDDLSNIYIVQKNNDKKQVIFEDYCIGTKDENLDNVKLVVSFGHGNSFDLKIIKRLDDNYNDRKVLVEIAKKGDLADRILNSTEMWIAIHYKSNSGKYFDNPEEVQYFKTAGHQKRAKENK